MDKTNADTGKSGEHLSSSPTISSSTESETFETWTLVTPELPTDRGKDPVQVQDTKVAEKRKSKNEFDHRSHPRQDHDDDHHIENIKKDDHHTDGEISDGISIISDSESGGRSSPQPAPRRLSPTKRHSPPKSSDLPSDEENDSDNNEEMTKTIIHSSFDPLTTPSPLETETAALLPKSANETIILHQNYERDTDSIDSETDRPLLQGFNFTYAFFLAVFVAILAMFGRMQNGPILDTRDLNSVYARLNEILTKTSHIETIIQDTMNGLDDRSFDQYSNMLMRMKELNEKFEANNLAMQDALYRLTRSQKYPAINPDTPDMKETTGDKNGKFENDERPVEARKPPNPNWTPKEKFRKTRETPTPQDKERHSQEPRNKYTRNDQEKHKNDKEVPTSEERNNKDIKESKDYKKREHHQKYQNGHTNGRKEQYENGKREAQPQNEFPGHENRKKNGCRKKNGSEKFKDAPVKRDSREEENDDWMERRRRFREDARKGSSESGEKRRVDDGNWYLERGNSRQKARKYEKAENRL